VQRYRAAAGVVGATTALANADDTREQS